MARSIYIFNTHDLPHRAGEMREYQLDLKIAEPVGVDLLSVKPGEVIKLIYGCNQLMKEFLLPLELWPPPPVSAQGV